MFLKNTLVLTGIVLIISACGKPPKLPTENGVETPFIPLNDTGVSQYLNYQNHGIDNTALPGFSVSAIGVAPGQDADYGTANLTDNGFRFQKHIGVQRNPVAADSVDPFDCVSDEVTGLTWEHKNNDSGSAHYAGHQFNWHLPLETINGGNAGASGKGQCAFLYGDTWGFLESMNAQQFCGYSDWRLPTTEELRSLIDYNQSTSTALTDQAYFPHVSSKAHLWSADTDVNKPTHAVGFHMHEGNSQIHNKVCTADNATRFFNSVMLVRGGTTESPIQ